MKAAAFNYARATSVAHALDLLAAHGDGAKLLAGGQSLVPAMNLRLITPETIVDIGGLMELRGISVRSDTLRIGALTRHVDIARSLDIARCTPLLAEAIMHVAHPAIRNRGTLGGSLAHADPAAELPACMLALDATIVVQGPEGERRIAALDFFTGIYETALSSQELLVAVEIPVQGDTSTHYFHEFARRLGDYGIVGLAAQASIAGGQFEKLRLAYFAVGDRPVLAASAQLLIGRDITSALVADVGRGLEHELEPQEDQEATVAMRFHLAKVLLRRCIAAFLGRDELGLAA